MDRTPTLEGAHQEPTRSMGLDWSQSWEGWGGFPGWSCLNLGTFRVFPCLELSIQCLKAGMLLAQAQLSRTVEGRWEVWRERGTLDCSNVVSWTVTSPGDGGLAWPDKREVRTL